MYAKVWFLICTFGVRVEYTGGQRRKHEQSHGEEKILGLPWGCKMWQSPDMKDTKNVIFFYISSKEQTQFLRVGDSIRFCFGEDTLLELWKLDLKSKKK